MIDLLVSLGGYWQCSCGKVYDNQLRFCELCGQPRSAAPMSTPIPATMPERPVAKSSFSIQDSIDSGTQTKIMELRDEKATYEKRKIVYIGIIIAIVSLLIYIRSDSYIGMVKETYLEALWNGDSGGIAWAETLAWLYDKYIMVLLVGILGVVFGIAKFTACNEWIDSCQREIDYLISRAQQEKNDNNYWHCVCGRANPKHSSSCVCGALKRMAVSQKAINRKVTVPKTNKWQCTCGKVNEHYVFSCSCGKNKRDVVFK